MKVSKELCTAASARRARATRKHSQLSASTSSAASLAAMKVVFSRNRVAHLGLLLSLSALVAEVPKREPASAQSMIRAHSTRARISRGARRARSSDAQRSDGARRAAERDDAIAPPPP